MLAERIPDSVQLLDQSRDRAAENGSKSASDRATGTLWPNLALRIAEQGTRGSAESLPHLAAVQEAFGRHDLSGVKAHLGDVATRASSSLGANAFAFRDHVAFGAERDVRTTAHEAAHVVQQRAGVQLPGGVGQTGDTYERNADEVADRVERGESAEGLLDRVAGSDRAGAIQATVQRAATTEEISETTDTGNTYKQSLKVDTDKNTILVSLGVKWVKADTWADDTAFNAFTTKVKGAVNSYMNNMFKITATPKGADAGAPFDVPIAVQVVDDASGHPVNCHGGVHGRSQMTTTNGDLYELGQSNETTLPNVTIAHEFGHALMGASDEYANPAVPARVLTSDHSIMANYYTEGQAAAEFKVRHFQHLLAPIQAHYPSHTLTLAKK